MEVRRHRRAAAVLAALLAVLLSGCAFVVIGRPPGAQRTPPAADDTDAGVVGATEDAVDVQARNALADLQTFWTQQFPAVFGGGFPPLQGGYFSVDPDDADPSVYPQGIGCGQPPEPWGTTPSTARRRGPRTPTPSATTGPSWPSSPTSSAGSCPTW